MKSGLPIFLDNLQRQHCTYHVISPLPTPKKQRGPTCGYSASRYVTDFYNLCNPELYSTLPARKSDTHPKSTDSYRRRGKKSGIAGTGGIWDVKQFQGFLHDYQVDILTFNSKKEMVNILLFNLHLNQPVVVAVDISEYDTRSKCFNVGLAGGDDVHYITIIGYYNEKDGGLKFIFNTWEYYMVASDEEIFNSSNNLRTHSPIREYKESLSGEWKPCNDYRKTLHVSSRIQNGEKIRIHETSAIDLSNIRNQCVLMYPANFNKTAHYSMALKHSFLSRNNINSEAVKTLFKYGAETNQPVLNKFHMRFHSNMCNEELISNINFINSWKAENTEENAEYSIHYRFGSREVSALSRTCTMMHRFFKLELDNRGAKKLLTDVLHADETAYCAIVKIASTNPELFFIKATAMDQAMDLDGNRRIIKDWSAYQALITTGGDILEKIKPSLDKYLNSLPNGHVFAMEQIQEKFPHGLNYPPSTYDFNPLIQDITHDTKLITSDTPSQATLDSLMQFRNDFKPDVVIYGHHFNMNDLIQAEKILDQHRNEWEEYQILFFNVNIIGFLERLLTAPYMQNACYGIHQKRQPMKRCFEVTDEINYAIYKKITVYPLDADLSCRLGKDFVIRSNSGVAHKFFGSSYINGPDSWETLSMNHINSIKTALNGLPNHSFNNSI